MDLLEAMEGLGNMTDMGPFDLMYHLADKVMGSVEHQIAYPASLLSDFVETVTWSEPFILSLLALHVVLFSVVLLTRRKLVVQISVFVVITAAVLLAERLNNYGQAHWMKFATQNYFDRNGLFAMIFYAGPLLIVANIILINLCLQTARLAVLAKRAKLRAEAANANAHSTTNGHDKTE